MSEVDEEGTALFHQTMPFTKLLGVEALEHGKDVVRARLAWDESLCTLGGVLHGGVLMSLADATAAVSAFLNLPEGAQGTTTIESKTNFLRPVRGGHALATARPLHAGRRVIVVETEIHDDAGALAAKVTQTQAVL
ncbi:PaaI family thioesterase [Amycolatopsis taiwanensis]|uniref:Aromatic compound degradation protein PaaI n=1 Tax=Amycolatopsis taiwanensis TaxID=342230 RepID=A0A9W6QZM7_9PSEU|nr:PaaI family thioesterase [Amycolatopsis taiwanensis]GLY65563.1 aromatic compound degradation protein PaaI [Amycolatopsis taiwanensis]